jgi:hypothetical protein
MHFSDVSLPRVVFLRLWGTTNKIRPSNFDHDFGTDLKNRTGGPWQVTILFAPCAVVILKMTGQTVSDIFLSRIFAARRTRLSVSRLLVTVSVSFAGGCIGSRAEEVMRGSLYSPLHSPNPRLFSHSRQRLNNTS